MEYGEGVLRMDKATGYLIRAVRFCKTRWGLTDSAMMVVLMRVLYAETPDDKKPYSANALGTRPTAVAIKTKATA
jgi:hypothetical protein